MGNGQLEWSDDNSPKEIEDAFENRDHATVGRLLDSLCANLDKTGRCVDAKIAKKVLALLRKYAWFDKLNMLAEKFDKYAQDDEQVLRQLAQARIELGEITTAVSGLFELRGRIEGALDEDGLSAARRDMLEYELGETMGLLGRAYKQYYVNAKPSQTEPRSHDLTSSLNYYGDAYHKRLGDYLWHGINYVALLTHQERIARNRRNAISDKAGDYAREILKVIDNKANQGPLQPWDMANQIEANLATGDTPAAILATRAYLDRADAFNVQSTRRQLIEIWMLNENEPPGDEILPMMNARFAELGGVSKVIDLDPAKAANYEKVWGKTKYMPLRWLNEALDRATAVARIGPNKYDGDGTGFLFDGTWISDDWAGKPLLLTNAHVCSDDPDVQAQYPNPSPPEELTATFLGSGGASDAVELKFKKKPVWTSPPSQLDATLLLLEDVPKGCSPPPLATRKPPVTLKGDARLNILGHPKGLDLRVSLQDNKTVDVGETYVHYKTPTDPGSSGSPVFNQKWQLVALHHASSSRKEANEGIRIDVIIDAIKAEAL